MVQPFDKDLHLTISVVGPFRVQAKDGPDLTPRGRKACGVLALLAFSPRFQRSRKALQDILWSDRAPEQSSSSLRQVLSEIRRSLGLYRDVLNSDSQIVSLARDRVKIDIDLLDLSAIADARHRDSPVLLEDLDLRDPEFERWLKDQREEFQQTLVDRKADRPRGVFRQGTAGAFAARRPAEVARPWVRILQQRIPSGDSGAFIAQIVGDWVVRGISEQGAVDICEQPRDTPGIELRVEVLPTPEGNCVHVALFSAHAGTQLWSGTQSIANSAGFIIESPQLHTLINQAADVAGIQLRKMLLAGQETSAAAYAYSAIQKMHRLDRGELVQADALLKAAYEQDSKGVFLAWRAYARTFLVGDHGISDVQGQRDEAESLVRKAIEADPQNSTALALASYVYSFMFQDYAVGHELAQRSLKYNPANVFGLAFLGRAKSYLGQYEEGYRLAARARETCGPGPHQYTVDFLCGMTAMLSGRFEEAIRLGEYARALSPLYRPPQRYLIPLYLRAGETGKARDVFENLRLIEPGFSLDAMREASYPSAGLRESGILEFSDIDL